MEAEGEDEDQPECDGTSADGSPLLIPHEYLAPGILELAVQIMSVPLPASLLLSDEENADEVGIEASLCHSNEWLYIYSVSLMEISENSDFEEQGNGS